MSSSVSAGKTALLLFRCLSPFLLTSILFNKHMRRGWEFHPKGSYPSSGFEPRCHFWQEGVNLLFARLGGFFSFLTKIDSHLFHKVDFDFWIKVYTASIFVYFSNIIAAIASFKITFNCNSTIKASVHCYRLGK